VGGYAENTVTKMAPVAGHWLRNVIVPEMVPVGFVPVELSPPHATSTVSAVAATSAAALITRNVFIIAPESWYPGECTIKAEPGSDVNVGRE
jgi:hypothetical protein